MSSKEFQKCKVMITRAAHQISKHGGTRLASEKLKDYDSKNNGYISTRQLGDFFKKINLRHSHEDFTMLLKYLDPRGTEKIFYCMLISHCFTPFYFATQQTSLIYL
jgi:Ca2+-binding EF-hand superfamily protein